MTVSWLKAEQAIAFLQDLDPGEERENGAPGQHITPEQGDQIAAFLAERGGFDLFVELDERPGRYDHQYANSGWHWKLRQARNDTRNHFFDVLNGRAVA